MLSLVRNDMRRAGKSHCYGNALFPSRCWRGQVTQLIASRCQSGVPASLACPQVFSCVTTTSPAQAMPAGTIKFPRNKASSDPIPERREEFHHFSELEDT